MFLPSENEWYKAAYYDPSHEFVLSSTRPAATRPRPRAARRRQPTHANYQLAAVGNLTDVGAYTRNDEPLRRVRHGRATSFNGTKP